MKENNKFLQVKEGSELTIVTDPETGKEYKVPNLSGSPDLVKMIQESNPKYRKIPPETRILAAGLYMVLNSTRKVAQILDFHESNISAWKKEPWWHAATREIRKTKNEELDNKFTSLLDDIVDEIADRVNNGETVVDKDGNIHKVPAKLSQLATTMGITYDKRALLRGDPTSKVAKVDVNEHLENVAARLEKLVGKIPEPEIFEGEFDEINENTETGGNSLG